MITFWCHQPKQFPKMGTRERLPTEGLEENEKKANFKVSKCFQLACFFLVPIVNIRMGSNALGQCPSKISCIGFVAIGSLLKLFIVGGGRLDLRKEDRRRRD